MQPFTSAQEASYVPLVFAGEQQLLNTSLKLEAKCYRGAGPVVIKPEKGQRCSLEIPATSVLESVKFIVKNGAELRISGSLLRECMIIVEVGAAAVIDSSALQRCEFGSDAIPTQNPPSLRMTNCVMVGGGWQTTGTRLGLEMIDCMVKDQLSRERALRNSIGGENTTLNLARRPSIRYTKFENCLIHPTLLLTVSQVTMENCTGMFNIGAPLFGSAANATPEVLLPVRWVNNQPAELPQIGAGVGIQQITNPISGGCTLAVKSHDGKLTLDGTVNSTPELLSTFLPVPLQKGRKPAQAAPMVTEDKVEVKLKQAHINGLLVMSLATGKEAGQVTKMNLTVVPGSSSLRFGQYVGEDMNTALREVQKFVQLRHLKMPMDVDMEIAFEEKYSEKDGPSAAVACALLVESVITGKVWDPTFAVTGDMNADGSIQPIGGVAAKVRGATKGSCRMIAVPAKNESSIADILVLDGPGPLAAIHVFALDKFEQAVNLATTERPTSLQQAVSEFEIISGVLQRDPRQMTAILRTPQAIARLQAVYEKAPNSLSAKYLLLFAQGRLPATLSLGGSLEAADANALGLVSSIQKDFKGTVSSLKQDELGGTLNRLRNLRPRLDQRVWGYVDALVDYGEIVRSEVLNPARTNAKFNEMAARARLAAGVAVEAKKALMADPEVLEDLGL